FLFARTLPLGPLLQTGGEAVRDGVEPGADGALAVERRGLACEDEEDGLEHVLGVLGAGEHAAARPQHEWPVAAHERLERGGVAAVGEALQQLTVGERVAAVGQFAQGFEYARQVFAWHGRSSLPTRRPPPPNAAQEFATRGVGFQSCVGHYAQDWN